MRKVLASNQQVAHYFANQIQAEGSCSNFSFSEGKLYSYGHHFCVARHLSNGIVAFTTRTYSVSTSKHLAYARSALRHRTLVYCNDPASSARANMGHARNKIRDELVASERKGIRQTTRDSHKACALATAENANAYLAALPLEESEGCTPIDTSSLEGVRAALIAAEDAAARIRQEQQAARIADLQEALTGWRAGGLIHRTGLHSIPPALRLAKSRGSFHTGGLLPDSGSEGREVIQTSHGAEIPVSDARLLWPLILAVKSGETTSEHAQRVMQKIGVYTLTNIRFDGSLVVGCHDIAFSEIERIAVELGLLVPEEA